MSTCYIRSFDPVADKSYKKTLIDRLIMIKSELTHSEFQFSHRYGGISVSATGADKCWCVRFKFIDYEKHPKRWKRQAVPLTDAQEDWLFELACIYAGIVEDVRFKEFVVYSILQGSLDLPRNITCQDECFFTDYAWDYDTFGVIVCNISHRRILPGASHKVWCSEFVAILLKEVWHDFVTHPDSLRPDNLYERWEEFEAIAYERSNDALIKPEYRKYADTRTGEKL